MFDKSEEGFNRNTVDRIKSRLESALRNDIDEEEKKQRIQPVLEELGSLLNTIVLGEKEWRAAFDAVQTPMFFHGSDYRISRANKAYAKCAEMKIQDVIGKLYWEVFPKSDGPLPGCARLLDQKEHVQSEEVLVDNGKIFLSRGFAVNDTEGNYLYSVHIMEDITEKRILQNALEENVQRYRRLFDGAPDSIFVFELESGRILDVNTAAQQLIGRTHEELMELNYLQLLSPDISKQHSLETYQAAGLHPATQSTSELALLHANGQKIPVEVSTQLFELDGKKAIQCIYRDITERKRIGEKLDEANRQLNLSLNLLKDIIESVPIRVFWKDKNLTYLGCNLAFAHDAGMSNPDELIGKTDYDMGWKEQAELYRRDDQRVIESGETKLGYEEPQTTPDGSTIWLRTSKVPLRNEAQEVIGVLGIYDDITRQKQMEQELLLSESRLKEAQAVANLGSWELDLVKDNLWWSDENYRIFGVEPGTKNTYETFLATIHPEDREFVNEAYTSSVDNKTAYNIEHRLLLPDGSVKWVNERCKTYYDNNGKPLRSAGTTLDITERKLAEAQTARLGRILDSSISEIYVFDASNLNFLLVNEGALRNLGYSRQEMTMLTPLDLKPDFTPQAFTELLAPLRQDSEKVLVFETRHQRKDKSLYPAEVHLQYSAHEAPPVFVASILDITERYQADEKLRHSEAGLAEAQRIAHLGNWEFDIIENHLRCSDEIYRIFEIEPEGFDASYEAFLTAVHPGDREQVASAYRSSLENKLPYDITHRLLMPDGRTKYVRQMCETQFDCDGRALRSLGTMQDITQQHLTGEALNRSNRALRAISSCNSVLVRATDQAELLHNMCRVIIEDGGYRLAWIGFVEEGNGKRVVPAAHAGYENGYLEHINVTWDESEYGHGPAGYAVRAGKPGVVHDILVDPHFTPWREAAVERGFRSVLALPLTTNHNEVFGVLNIDAAEPHAFDTEAIKLMQELANDLSFGILALRTSKERDHYLEEHRKSDERYKQALVDTIRAITLTVEKRDPYTAGHQNRVAQLSVAIGRELGMDEDRLEGLRLGAMIHDIGKIYVPAEILNRPGRLSNAEFEIIKSHTEVGYDIIKDVKFPWPVADMVVQHHERLDGSGYPKGLSGDKIILEARILAVADVVEAITAHRPYRPAVGLDKALAEIESKRETCYDSAVVNACLHLIRDKGFAFDESAGL